MSPLLFLFTHMQRSLFFSSFLFTRTHSECLHKDFLVSFLTQFSKNSLNQGHTSYTALISPLNHQENMEQIRMEKYSTQWYIYNT